MSYRVIYESIDGYRESRRYKGIAAARKWAVHMVGPSPELGSHYAISGDGVGKVKVEGCGLRYLIGLPPYGHEDEPGHPVELAAPAPGPAAADPAAAFDWPCRCSPEQLRTVGCDCDAIPY